MKRLRLKIYGHVRGVFFRATIEDRARQRGLIGFVRNCADGCVEVVAEGAEGALRELLAYCQHGPPLARVERVEEEWREVAEFSFATFTIR